VISGDLTDELYKAFIRVVDRQVISNPTKILNQIIKIEKKFENPSGDLKAAFEKFNESLKDLLATYPSEVPERCVDQKQKQIRITNLTKMMIILNHDYINYQ
jgi:hypothetical protein